MTPRGFSVRLYFPEGEPNGLRVIERSNWTGQGVAFPRVLLSQARTRSELKRPGVYALWDRDERQALPRIYVGQSDNVLSRLLEHTKGKDFWTDVAAFTSKDSSLNGTHARFLESELIRIAMERGRSHLMNGNSPAPPPISEADQADAMRFLDDMLTCLPVLGLSAFQPTPDSSNEDSSGDERIFLRARSINAQATISADGFTVLKESQAHKEPTPSFLARAEFRGNVAQRQSLIDEGVLVDNGATWVMARDYTFSSPSAATAVLVGSSPDPYQQWKTTDGRTLDEVVRGGDE